MDDEEWDDFAAFEGSAEVGQSSEPQAAVDPFSFDSHIPMTTIDASNNGQLSNQLPANDSVNVVDSVEEDEWDDFNGATHSVAASAEPHTIAPSTTEEPAPQSLSEKIATPEVSVPVGESVLPDSLSMPVPQSPMKSGNSIPDIFDLAGEATLSHQPTIAAALSAAPTAALPVSPVLIIQSQNNPLDQLDEWDEFESHTPVANAATATTATTVSEAFAGVVQNEEVNEPSPPPSPVTTGAIEDAAGVVNDSVEAAVDDAPLAEAQSMEPAPIESASPAAPVVTAMSAGGSDPLADIWDEIENFTPTSPVPSATAPGGSTATPPDTSVPPEAPAVEVSVAPMVEPVVESVQVPPAALPEPAQVERDAFSAFDALDLDVPSELPPATPVPEPPVEPESLELPSPVLEQEVATQAQPAVVETVEGTQLASPEDALPSAALEVAAESIPSTPVDVPVETSSPTESAVVESALSDEKVLNAPLPVEPADAFSAFDDLLVDAPPAAMEPVPTVSVASVSVNVSAALLAEVESVVEPPATVQSSTQDVLPEETELEVSIAEASPAAIDTAVPALSSPMRSAPSTAAAAFDELFNALDADHGATTDVPAADKSTDCPASEQPAHSATVDTIGNTGDASPAPVTTEDCSPLRTAAVAEQVVEAPSTPMAAASATSVGDAFSAFDDLDVPLDVPAPVLTISRPTDQPVDQAPLAVDMSALTMEAEPLPATTAPELSEPSESAGDEWDEFESHTPGPAPASASTAALDLERAPAVNSSVAVVADLPVDVSADVPAGGDQAANAVDGEDEWDEFEGHADTPSAPAVTDAPSVPLPVETAANPAEIDVFADIPANIDVPAGAAVAEVPVPVPAVPVTEEDEWDEFATPTAAPSNVNVVSPLAAELESVQPAAEETLPIEFPPAVQEDQSSSLQAAAVPDEDDWDDFEGPATTAAASAAVDADASAAPSNMGASSEAPQASLPVDDFASVDAFSPPVQATAGDVFGALTGATSRDVAGAADAEDDEWDAFEGPAVTTATTPATTAVAQPAAPAASAVTFAAFEAAPASASAPAHVASFAAFQQEPTFAASFDNAAAGMTTAGEFGNGFTTSGEDEWNAFDSHNSGADDFGGFADSNVGSATTGSGTSHGHGAPAAFEASFDAQFDSAGASSSSDSFAAFGNDSATAFGSAASFAAFSTAAPAKKVATVAPSTPAVEFLSPAALQAMAAPATLGASDVTFIKTLPHMLLSEEQSKAYNALSSLCGGLFSDPSTSGGGNTKLLQDLQSAGTLAHPLSATKLDLRNVVNAEAIQSAAAVTNSNAMRMVPEIEAFLSSNAPADALSLQDLALLLESFELKRAMQKKQVAAPVVHHKAPQSSSSDKKRLSIDPIAVAKAERGTSSEPATSSNSPIDFLFGRRASGTSANSSSGNLAASAGGASGGSSAVSPNLSNSPPRPSGAPTKPPTATGGSNGGSNGTASATNGATSGNNSSLPPRVATRKSSFMGLTAALSAATATATTSPGNNMSTASPSTAAAIAVLGSEKSKGEGYYGDSNANLSPAALEFLNALPDLSYILS